MEINPDFNTSFAIAHELFVLTYQNFYFMLSHLSFNIIMIDNLNSILYPFIGDQLYVYGYEYDYFVWRLLLEFSACYSWPCRRGSRTGMYYCYRRRTACEQRRLHAIYVWWKHEDNALIQLRVHDVISNTYHL